MFGVFTSKLNWQDADSDCKKRSATLAVFETWESIKWFENLRHTNTSELLRTFNPLTALKIARQKLIKIEMSLSLRRVQNRQKQTRKTMMKALSLYVVTCYFCAQLSSFFFSSI